MGSAIVVWTALITILLVRHFYGWPSSSTLLDHQRGILFHRGTPKTEVGAGRHRVWVGVEKILFVDTRPIAVSFENRAVTLSDGSTAIYGFSGSAEISDVTKVLYSANNYSEMPAFVLLCCARLVLNRQDSPGLVSRELAISDAILSLAKPRLAAAGFRPLTFKISQLGIASPMQSSTAN